MRVLRTSVYIDAYNSPLVTVARDRDLRDTVDSVAQQLLTPGFLVLNDIFETADTGIAEATAMAMDRLDRFQEKHMAMLYHWVGDTLPIVSPSGTLLMDKPTPLDSESMRVALDQLTQHPNYKRQTVIGYDTEGKEVRLDGAGIS